MYELIKRGHKVPDEPQSQFETVHDIVFKQNKFDDGTISSPEIMRNVPSFSHLTLARLRRQTDAARFQDMFQLKHGTD